LERLSLNYITRCASITVLLISGSTVASHAFTMQRLAAAIDVSQFAGGTISLPSSGLVGANIPAGLSIPATVNLLGPITELRVGIPSECDVTIEVADDAGAPLFLAQMHMPAGWQKIGFSARDAEGNLLPNGTYYYTLTADGISRTTRVVVNR
jgi:hypothetical protein